MKNANSRARRGKVDRGQLSIITVLNVESGWGIKMFRKIAALVLLLLVASPAYAEKTEAKYNLEIRRLELEIRKNHPEVQWVNGKLFKITV